MKKTTNTTTGATSRLTDDALGDLFSFLPSPVLVSHVCRRWRRIALESAVLWSILVLDPQEYATSSSRDRIAEFIQRSKAHVLTLDFKFGAAQRLVFMDILELVLPLAARWKYLYVSSQDHSSVLYLLHNLQHVQVPILKHLSITCEAQPPVEGITFALPVDQRNLRQNILLGGAPALTAFRVFGVAACSFQPNLSNLTCLMIDDPGSIIQYIFSRAIPTYTTSPSSRMPIPFWQSHHRHRCRVVPY